MLAGVCHADELSARETGVRLGEQLTGLTGRYRTTQVQFRQYMGADAVAKLHEYYDGKPEVAEAAGVPRMFRRLDKLGDTGVLIFALCEVVPHSERKVITDA